MKYYVEEDAGSFEFWAGARDNINTARELGTDGQVFSILEELFYDGDSTDTQINDYVWFDMPNDYPELFGEEGEDGDEDDDEWDSEDSDDPFDGDDEDYESNTINESKKTSGNKLKEHALKRVALLYSNGYYSKEKLKEVEDTIIDATGLSDWDVREWTERSMILAYWGDPNDLTPELVATAKKIFKEML